MYRYETELCECGSFGGCLGRLPPGSLVDERDVWVLAAQVAAGLTHIHAYGGAVQVELS